MSVEDYHSALLHRLRDRLQLKTFEDKGRGLAAAKAIAIGEVLMVEEPLLSHQFAGNASIVDSCHQCQRFVGTLQQQLNKLATVQIPEHFSAGVDSEAVFEKQEALDAEYPSLPDRLSLPCLDAESAVISKVVVCPYGCGAQFCSDSCLDKALRQHHILLCTHFKPADATATHAGASAEEATDADAINAALLFRQQALQTSEMFLFAAKLLGRVLEAWSRNGNNLEAALAPFLALHSAPLWKVRGLRELADAQIDAMLRQQATEEGREAAEDAPAKGAPAGAGAGAGAPGDDGEEGTGVIPLKFLLARVNAEEAALAKAGAEGYEGMFDGLRAQVGEQLLDSLTILRALVTERLPGIVAYIRDGRVPSSGAGGEAAHAHHGKPAAAGAGAGCGHDHGSGACGHDHGHHGDHHHHHHHEDGAACTDASHSHAAAPASSAIPSSGVEAAAAPASGSASAVGLNAFRDWEADMLFDPALYERLVAACELNAIEVKIDSPLRDYLSIVRSLPRKAAKGAAGSKGGKAGKGKSGGGVSPYESAMIELAPLLEQMRGARQARKRVRREMEALKQGDEEEEDGEEKEEEGAAGKTDKAASEDDDDEEEDDDEEDDDDFDSDFDTDEEEDEDEDEEEDDGFGLSAREVRRLCPLSKGSALFAVISCLNHSCEPNVQVAYAEGDRRAALIPMRKLAEGEEVCINYCDVEQELDQRRVDILQYGFVCGCARCKADEAKLADSSSA